MRREHNIQTEIPLPSGYTKLDYIKSTGTQYIDTQVSFSTKPNFEIVVSFSQNNHNQWIFGFWTNNIAGGYIGVYNNSFLHGFGADNNNNRTPIGLIPYDANKHTFITDRSGSYFDGNKVATSDFTKNTPLGYLRLFTRYNIAGTMSWQEPYNGVLLYRCILTDANNNLIRDYLPALRQSDNRPGLYDLCGTICPLTNTPFYINVGTGEFQYA